MNSAVTTSNFDSDLFSSEVITKYFNAREQEIYFHSLRHADDRRSIYPQVLATLGELLAFFDDAASLELLDSCIFRHRQQVEKVSQDCQILDYLKGVNPRGVELLALTGPTTFDSLRAARNNSAKKYHPDLGGSNEEMKLVNIAYSAFHDIISQWKETPAQQSVSDVALGPDVGHLDLEFQIRSATEYLNWLGAILVSVHTDSWAVDRGCTMLKLLHDHALLSQRFTQEENFVGYFARPLFQLAERLHAANLVEEAQFVQRYAFPLLTPGGRTSPFIEVGLTRASSILSGKQKLTIVIKHPCQAENLFRLNLIDETRYCQVQARFRRQHAESLSSDLDLASFQEFGGFISPLSYDTPFRCDAETKTLVPVPNFPCERINHLSDEQRAEYFRAFGPLGSRDAIDNYLTIRISSYLCSLIHSFSVNEAERIEHECEFLWGLFPERLGAFETVQRVSEHLCRHDPVTRTQKLTLLQKLDTSERLPEVRAMRGVGEGQGEHHIRIEPRTEYVTVVMASLDRLQMALQTGSILTPAEESQKRAVWNRDMRFIQNLNQTSVATKAKEAEWYHRHDSEKLVDTLKPHIRQLLDAGSKVAPENRGHLQLGYEIEAISAALVKLKRWDEGRYWLELFFGLDPDFQEGPERDKEKMLRRLERCKAKLAKGV
jgi:hypothetical protein